jgi:hypothetical protein
MSLFYAIPFLLIAFYPCQGQDNTSSLPSNADWVVSCRRNAFPSELLPLARKKSPFWFSLPERHSLRLYSNNSSPWQLLPSVSFFVFVLVLSVNFISSHVFARNSCASEAKAVLNWDRVEGRKFTVNLKQVLPLFLTVKLKVDMIFILSQHSGVFTLNFEESYLFPNLPASPLNTRKINNFIVDNAWKQPWDYNDLITHNDHFLQFRLS